MLRIGKIALLFGTLLFSTTSTSTPFSTLIILGDSLSDSGNLLAASTAHPTLPPIPDPRYYFEGRFHNGKNYADLLWEQLGYSGALTPSLLGGTNYAVGGARSRYHVFDIDPATGLPPALGSAPRPFSLLDQFSNYQADTGGTADPDAIHVVFSGANDVTDALVLAGDPAAASDLLMQTVTDIGSVLGQLVGMGAQHLLVPNIPDLGKAPEVVALGASTAATAFSQAVNDGVDAILAGFTGINVIRFDTFAALDQILDSPSSFGFTNTTDACLQNFFVLPPATGTVTVCNAPDDYVFWDAIHPTAATHAVLADRIFDAVVPVPLTLLLFAIGAMGLISVRMRAVRG